MRFKLITPNQLQAVVDERSRKAMEKMKAAGLNAADIMQTAEAARAARAAHPEPEPVAPEPKPKPPTIFQVVNAYDRTLLLATGIAAWGGGCYDGIEVGPATVDDLDASTSFWAAKQILALNRLIPEGVEGYAGN